MSAPTKRKRKPAAPPELPGLFPAWAVTWEDRGESGEVVCVTEPHAGLWVSALLAGRSIDVVVRLFRRGRLEAEWSWDWEPWE